MIVRLRDLALLLAGYGMIAPAGAQPWEFNAPIEVTSVHGEGIFHHLESAGRRNIAVAGETVAISWEDNRQDGPAIYLSRKRLDADSFGSAVRLSETDEAYEPSLAAVGPDRFAVAWEEAGRVRLRLVDQGKPGPVLSLPDRQAGQASLAAGDGDAVWLIYTAADNGTRHRRVYLRRIRLDKGEPAAGEACAVDPEPLEQAQLYPTVVKLPDRSVAAWEDRRHGHTIIMAAENREPGSCRFAKPQRISEPPPGPRPPYGKGHGVTRVALAAYGQQRILAAWADKRDFREGYDIYASHYPGEDDALFGPNEKVQDPFGGVAQQWHPAVTGHPDGQRVTAWDDDRDDQTNILLSWHEAGQWSDDLPVPGASGAPEQNHPSIVLDADGNLHLAWVERQKTGGATRLRYLFGERTSDATR
ncbi:hypothetical protein [Thiohalophilus thiocyanatoxydans]|uniref:WD40 repeat protein n=1 Tax=Thiohalophilus thiocyanatoxydans TaxID=381308 RepID=A0A4R8IS99_9GAMM|nr:hypothetical protein [Thiohalophilus thiocyanatoxydans]TDY03912.1 hypothetical protein EDC23_0283 [Thiohalophilus thiocyanatoxydans]